MLFSTITQTLLQTTVISNLNLSIFKIFDFESRISKFNEPRAFSTIALSGNFRSYRRKPFRRHSAWLTQLWPCHLVAKHLADIMLGWNSYWSTLQLSVRQVFFTVSTKWFSTKRGDTRAAAFWRRVHKIIIERWFFVFQKSGLKFSETS